MLIDELTEKIKKQEPFQFVKRGDAELECMEGRSGGNLDKHPYSADLANALRDSFTYLEAYGATIVEFANDPVYISLLHLNRNPLEKSVAFWEAVRADNRLKIYVAPERLCPAATWLGAVHISVPLINAWASYQTYQQMLLKAVKENCIVLTSVTMPAKVLIADVCRLNDHLGTVTCIDAGSAFDNIFVGETRLDQAPMDLLKRMYKL